MHLLREGQFDVASTFIEEAHRHPPHPEPTLNNRYPSSNTDSWEQDLAEGAFNSENLQRQFADMYHILHELRNERNLEPAIQWARERSDTLEARGSNLEFELCRLQFVCLFVQDQDDSMDDTPAGPLRAWNYARQTFGMFSQRYAREIQHLMGAMAYYENVEDSPYQRYFYNDSAWEEVAHSFNREFCSLLGLSADSPLFIAATALPAENAEYHERAPRRMDNTERIAGRDTATKHIPLPLNLRLPCQQRADHRRKSANDDALWSCHSQRVARQALEGRTLQVSVLPNRKPSPRRKEGRAVGQTWGE
jgi:hypothetical protein